MDSKLPCSKSWSHISQLPEPIMQNPLAGDCSIVSICNAFRVLHPRYRGTDYESLLPLEEMYNVCYAAIPTRSIRSLIKSGYQSIWTPLEAAIKHHKSATGEHIAVTSIGKSTLSKDMLSITRAPDENRVWIVGLSDHWSVAYFTCEATIQFYDSYAPERLRNESWSEIECDRIYVLERA